MKNFTFLLILFAVLSTYAYGQIDITYPNTRAVFQRNNANVGFLHFGGNFTTALSRVEARLIPVNGGSPVDWTVVAENPQAGFYKGTMSATGGWYRLEVRGIANGLVIGQTALERIGVGEVFVICGQSNAQGYKSFEQEGANSDRVIAVDNFYSLNQNQHPFPTFQKIEAKSNIAPTGNGAWCWGRLGDLLVSRLNVPVLFINTAWEAMDIAQWRVSADGGQGINPISQLQAPVGFPFNSVKNSLHQYIHMLGVRSVLMHQGESDTFLQTSQEAYAANLQYMIEKTRQSAQKNVTYVVARVSRNQFKDSYLPVINAQNQIIGTVPNVFPGPNTDDVDERIDKLHFSLQGLAKVADKWNNSLSNDFFNNSIPQLAFEPILPQSSCNSQNQVSPLRLSLPSGFTNYRWSNGIENSVIDVNVGSYRGRATDVAGNTSYTPQLTYNSSPIPAAPTININGPTQFCEETRITRLTSSYPTNNVWNTSATTDGINVASSGNYSVTHTNFYGCKSTSNAVGITVFPKPTPKITASNSTNICSDEELFLISSSQDGNSWSTSETGNRIKINKTDNITLTVTSSFGCTATTQPLSVTVRPAAQKPTVTVEGSREFCADKSTTLVAQTPDNANFAWNNGINSQKIEVNQTSSYVVTATNAAGCSKKSDPVEIRVNALPLKPVVSADGPTSLCNDRALRLLSNEQRRYIWSNGDTTKNINVFSSGNYTVKTVSDKGCISPESDPLKVSFFETPLKPTIQKTGTFTLEAGVVNATNLSNITYDWQRDLAALTTKSGEAIKANESGNYKVKASTVYTTSDNKSVQCTSEESSDIYVEIDYTLNYSIYPNPVQNRRVSIETIEDYTNTNVLFYDYNGRLVKSFLVPVFDSRKVFDVSDINPGQYILKISNAAFTATRKLFVE